MTKQVQRVAAAMFVLFAALFVNLNYLHVIRADALAKDQRNARGLIREYQVQRGSILTTRGAEMTPIATSIETEARLRYLREYPEGETYAHVTGFYSPIFGRAELEQSFNDFLTGRAPEQFARNLGDLLAGRERVGDTVATTIVPSVQQAARDALGDQKGAVVALEPTTGDILALYSSPTYDPNRLASHDSTNVREAWDELQTDPDNPMLNRAIREIYPPGSTFKLVTAAAALEAGYEPDDTFEDPVRLDLPLTDADIGNFGGGTCNGGEPITLRRALEVSCNTTFAQLGLELGAERLVEQAERLGFNRDWDFQLPGLATSRIPKEGLDEPATAQSAIGQRDVAATPLQMAMVASAIAFDGTLMKPQIVDHVEDRAGRIIKQYTERPLVFSGAPNAQTMSRGTAEALTEMMVGVVESGSGRSAAIDGVTVAGKTGTAQTGEGEPPTVWFVAFAPAEQPEVAVAVVVDEGGRVGDEATGGAVAGPIARAVIQAALAADAS